MKIRTGFNVRIRSQRRGTLSFGTAMFVMALPALMFQTQALHKKASAEQLAKLEAYRQRQEQKLLEKQKNWPILVAEVKTTRWTSY